MLHSIFRMKFNIQKCPQHVFWSTPVRLFNSKKPAIDIRRRVDELFSPIKTGSQHSNSSKEDIGIIDEFLLRPQYEREIIATRIALWLGLVVLTPMYVFDMDMPRGPSMLPTIHSLGDIVLIWYLPTIKYRVGDVVQCRISMKTIFKDGESSSNNDKDNTRCVIKRIVRIENHDGRSDSQRELDEFNIAKTYQGRQFWIEGDCPKYSRDSRHYGPISESCISGKVVMRLWPLRGNVWLLPNKKIESVSI